MTDTKDIISCPACGNEMKKIFFEEINANIDICADGCGGIFFDNRELKVLNKNADQVDEILKSLEGKEFEKVDDSKERTCPACGARMVKNKANNEDVKDNDFIVIDECYQCGGKFLDHGELERFKHTKAVKVDEKKPADIQYLYSQVGLANDSIEKDIAKASPLQKFFTKLLER